MLGRDGIAGLICLGGSLGLLALTRGLPQPALVPVGPAFYPRVVLVVTAALSAALVAADLLARRRHPARAAGASRAPLIRNWRLVLATFAIFTAYVFLLSPLGYRVTTFLFVAALEFVLAPAAPRHWARLVVVALVTALVTHLVFEAYLSVLLPRGRWTGM